MKRIAVVYSVKDGFGGMYAFWRDLINSIPEYKFTFYCTVEPIPKSGFDYVYEKSLIGNFLSKINLQDSLGGLTALRYRKELEKYDVVLFSQANAWPIARSLKNVRKINILFGTARACANAWKGKNLAGVILFKIKEFFEKKGASLCDKILTISEFSKKHLVEENIKKPIVDCGLGVDLSRFSVKFNDKDLREKYDFDKKDFLLLFVGRWSPGKGNDIVTETMKKVSNKKIKMVCVAKKPKDYKELKKYGIYFITGIPDTDLHKIYRMSDLFFFPSRYEGYGLVTAEAAASSIPIITTSTGFPWKLRKNKVLSRYILPIDSDINVFKERILELYSDKKKRELVVKEYLKNKDLFDLSISMDKFRKEIIGR
ncbi:hypothetical protein C0585_07560 [Candidatus Woesearchaeota archaeon]|nr:MAG: hypothetical protein C0585_07560 [Candidatus Woesearchaeota archaeon]